MYAITEDTLKINHVDLKTFTRDVKHTNTAMEVEAGTTGFRGSVPREKSARGFVAFRSLGDFKFSPVWEKGTDRIVGVEIACCGDSALMSLIDSLGFALEALTDECK